MTIPLESLRMFYYVVELKGFSKAAQFLGVSKSLISKKIAQLELFYQVKLLHRNHRQLQLTTAGKTLLPFCQQIIEASIDADHRIDALRETVSGTIRLSSPQLLGELLSADFIPEFTKQFPNVFIDLQIDSRAVNLIEDQYDLALRSARIMIDSTYIQRYFIQCTFVLCANPQFIENFGMPKHVQDLSRYHCAVYASKPNQYHTWPFMRGGQEFTSSIFPTYVSNQWTVLKNYAEKYPVLLHAPRYVVNDSLLGKKLIAIELDFPVAPAHLYILYLQRTLLPRHLQIFIEQLLDWSKKRSQVF